MNNIAIFGLGAIGSVLTKYLLFNKNNQLFYFNRSPKIAVNILFENELRIFPIELSNQKRVPFDWMIICLKAYHLTQAKVSIRQLTGPTTKIAVFRNGLHLAADFLDVLPSRNILETIIDCPTQLHPDGYYLQLKEPKITLPENLLAIAFKELFTHCEIQIDLIKSFKKAQWEKLIESSSLGALQVLAGQPCVIFKEPKVLAEYNKLITEGIVVANADGANISTNFKEELLARLKTYSDQKGSSMLADYLAGRPLELDAKLGVIIKIGVEQGGDIPFSKKIYQQLRKLNYWLDSKK